MCMVQATASQTTSQVHEQSLARLHRRLQRLQDERIHLESVLAHERSLLAQQQSDNAHLRFQLAAHQNPGQDEATWPLSHSAHAGRESGHEQVQRDAIPAQQQQQKQTAGHLAAQLQSVQVREQNAYAHQQHSVTDDASSPHLHNQLLQLQAELAMLDSEKAALCSQLQAQQAQHDSQHAALHSQLSSERLERDAIRSDLDRLLSKRLDDGAWQAYAVKVEAQHADLVSELQAAQAQYDSSLRQVQCSVSLVYA